MFKPKFQYQAETITAARILKPGTVAHDSHHIGLNQCEPLLVAMDSLIRYAKAHKAQWGPLSEDYALGPAWLAAAKGIRALLNGDGAVAMEIGCSTDSKDNGAVESMFWDALAIAGFGEDDL